MKITLCGSYAFQARIESIAKELEEHGHEVKYPSLPSTIVTSEGKDPLSIRAFIEEKGGIDALPAEHLVWDEKAKAIDNHFAKIAWADAILVINFSKNDVDGYIGGNTLMEIGVARSLSKKIYLMLRPSSKLSYLEEVLGTMPAIINEDLHKIV